MSIWVGRDTRLAVQGLTGREGTFHALACRDYGTQVVAGVTPGKGGTTHEGIPVFDTMAQAVADTGANATMSTISYGEEEPVAKNTSRKGRSQNRRVVVVVLA